jgi:NTE family protein
MRFAALVFALVATAPARAQDADSPAAGESRAPRPRVGLVLSGGGARGAAHIGVLRVLEELHVPVDAVAGTSMGSIIGGLYAAGLSPDQIQDAIAGVAWGEAFKDKPPRSNSSYRRKQDDRDFLVSLELGLHSDGFSFSRGLLQGQNLGLLLKHFAAGAELIEDFDSLPIPYRAVATDAITGDPVVLDSGDLAQAMRASMSVPGVFEPIEIDGRLLVDGGMSAQTPISVARRMGVDVLIVVDLTDEEDVPADAINTPFTLLGHLLLMVVTRNAREELGSLALDDILIQPNLEGYSSVDFAAANQMVPPGELSARALTWRLKELAIPEDEFEARVHEIRRTLNEHVRIDRVVVLNDSKLGDDVILERLDVRIGEQTDLRTLKEGIDEVYGLGYFESVTYDLERRGGENVMVVRANRKSWGPNYARFGLELSSDFQGRSVFSAGTRILATEMNKRGGEWITDLQIGNVSLIRTAFYQPLDRGLRWFVEPSVEYGRDTLDIYTRAGARVAEYQIEKSLVGIEGGYVFGNWAELRAGYDFGEGKGHRRTGDPSLPSGNFGIGELFVAFESDTLDSWDFPTSGQFTATRVRFLREGLGAEQDVETLEFLGSVTRTQGKFTTTAWSRIGVSDDAPQIQNFHAVGGLFNLSGLADDQLIGRSAGMVGLGLRKRFGDLEATLQRNTYIGVTGELGGAWLDGESFTNSSLVAAGSLYLAMDTVAGPFYLAWGHAEGGSDRLYLIVGRTISKL